MAITSRVPISRRFALRGAGIALLAGATESQLGPGPAQAASPPKLVVTCSDSDPSTQLHRQRMCRWGVVLDSVNSPSTGYAAFEARAGGHADIIGFFQQWSGYQGFPRTSCDAISAHGSTPQICWQAGDSSKPANACPDFAYSAIIAGRHDAYITKWAQDAKSFGRPLYLRLFHEFNGNWYAWSIGNNGNTPEDHVSAWRHVRQIFTAAGATNVQFVWCHAALHCDVDVDTDPITSCYPGDAYVDWLAFDAYNMGAYGSQGWLTVEKTLDNSYNCLQAISSAKPISLGEIGCAEDGGQDKGAWIRHLFGVVWSRYPQIRALNWMNHVSQDGRDNRITSSPGAQQAFSGGIRLSAYRPNYIEVSATDANGLTTRNYLPLPP